MVKDIFEANHAFFGDIEDGALLILKHAHASDVGVDIVSEELTHDAPNIGDSHEFLLELDLKGDEVLMSG